MQLKFFDEIIKQECKKNQVVCGDTYLSHRTLEYTIFILCDGIGSGVYANIASITCANRLLELLIKSNSMRSITEMVAENMHRARNEEFPFSAFIAVKILNDGQFTVYTYEAPNPIIIKDGYALELNSVKRNTGHEIVGSASGVLEIGDSLIIMSDGITQAGLGRNNVLGIGEKGIVEFINRRLPQTGDLHGIPSAIMEMADELSGGVNEDDATIIALNCRSASQLNVLTGPPAYKGKDKEYVEKFMALPGLHVICGSTTADIVARELNKSIEYINGGRLYENPPEYALEGMDLVTEGAIMLNQVYNIMEEDSEDFEGKNVVERLCTLMQEADIITFSVGNAINYAHNSITFKKIGVRPRQITVKLISQCLRNMGKLVVEEYF